MSNGGDGPRIMGAREWLLLGALMLVYLATRFWKIEHFPIYFFCDEAIQAVLGRDLVLHHLHNAQGTFLPTYFLNLRNWNLSLSIYIHAITATLFGVSITVTRGTSIVVGALAPVAAALTLRRIFAARLWWTAPLVMATLPAWFLHSRTAFETAMATAFYACFLLAYLLYRMESPRWLPLVFVAGAATAYAYTNGQGLVAFTGLALLAVDFRYHLRVIRDNRRVVAASLVLAALLAVPYLRFRLIDHPGAVASQLRDLNSYWVEDIPLARKLAMYGTRYLEGLSPRYWFRDDPKRPVRHRVYGRGHLPLFLAPFMALGLGACLWRWRSPPHRTVLIAVLAVPFSPAIVDILITRVLAMMVPATLLAVLGAELVWRRVSRWVPGRRARVALGAALAVALTADAAALARYCVRGGPTWFTDYGLYGMQWGARQLFGAIREELEAHPRLKIIAPHTWANNPDAFVRFFLTPKQRARVALFDPRSHQDQLIPFDPAVLYVLGGEEYNHLCHDPKIVCSQPLRILRYPDGRPGFVFLHLAYSEAAPKLFAAEEVERRRPRIDRIEVHGEQWVVQHPLLDIGGARDAFDGDPATVARSARLNPALWVVRFPSPRPVAGVELALWSPNYEIDLQAVGTDGSWEETRRRFHDLPGEPVVRLFLQRPVPDAVEIRLTIRKIDGDDFVHLRELTVLHRGKAPSRPE